MISSGQKHRFPLSRPADGFLSGQDIWERRQGF